MKQQQARPLLLLWAAAVLLLAASHASAATPAPAPTPAVPTSRLAVDFSSNLIVSPDAETPASVLARMDALIADMQRDGVSNLCHGHLEKNLCPGADRSAGATDCKLCVTAAQSSQPCRCEGRNNTRCSCSGQLTGAQYFSPANLGIEIARAVVVVNKETNLTVAGGINANFNTTLQLLGGSRVVITSNSTLPTGASDLELDNSHLFLLEGSQLVLQDDSDLESEDASTVWLAGGSSLSASNSSTIEARLNHLLVEGGSSINITRASELKLTQESDMTPVQASTVCNQPFTKDADAEYCFKNKEDCKKRWSLLTNAQKQAVFMEVYPPALDEWGRQAFDYSDDVLYDDAYDQDYLEPKLEAGACLGADVCGTSTTGSAASGPSSQPPIPAEPRQGNRRLLQKQGGADVKTPGAAPIITEINPPDSLDGKTYDPEFGEGPYGETLCDAPPFRSYDYYGMVVRGGSTISITANSTWLLQDQSRVFIQDSTIELADNATLHLQNSTMVLINSKLVLRGSSQVVLQFSSGLQLFNSMVLGDNAMYAVLQNATWGGQPWVAKGDYRASPGGALPHFMGAKPGVQLGSYPMRVAGFDLEARMLPAVGCKCKKPVTAAAFVSAAVTAFPGTADGKSTLSALAGLL